MLYRPVLWLTNKYSTDPDPKRVRESLTKLYQKLSANPVIELTEDKSFIVFSDLHKGAKDGADDFALAEANYLFALDYYLKKDYTLIHLGDVEELWENTLAAVKKNNPKTLEAENRFVKQNRLIKLFGNHDIYWTNDPLSGLQLKLMYGNIKVLEGLLIRKHVNKGKLDIFLTHGHQGDGQSDGNVFSAWFVSNIWAPLQSFLSINFNTPANDHALKTLHNRLMYEWSASQENVLLITGHTHQPVFTSMTFLENLYLRLEKAKKSNDETLVAGIQQQIGKAWKSEPPQKIKSFEFKPSYFNSGCCCFSDGDITGIELTAKSICLIKWEYDQHGRPLRKELDTIGWEELFEKLLHYTEEIKPPNGGIAVA